METLNDPRRKRKYKLSHFLERGTFSGMPNPECGGMPAAAGTPVRTAAGIHALMGAKMTYLRKLPDANASDVVLVHKPGSALAAPGLARLPGLDTATGSRA
jgi:hypothetical protein